MPVLMIISLDITCLLGAWIEVRALTSSGRRASRVLLLPVWSRTTRLLRGPRPPAQNPSILGPPPTHTESNFLEVLPETAFFTSPQESPGSDLSASGGRKPQEPRGGPALGAGEGETEEKGQGSVAQPVRTEPTTCPQHSSPATQVTGPSDCAGGPAVPLAHVLSNNPLRA